MNTVVELNLNPEFKHVVWVKMDGHIMSESAQEQRDQLAMWFLRSNIEESDIESVYATINENKPSWRIPATHMIFAFKDPQKAALFKLAWG
jgi:hypothetical protein